MGKSSHSNFGEVLRQIESLLKYSMQNKQDLHSFADILVNREW